MIDISPIEPNTTLEFDSRDEAVNFILGISKTNWIYESSEDKIRGKYIVTLLREMDSAE